MKTAFLSTFLHLLELALCAMLAIGLAYLAKQVLGINLNEYVEAVITAALAGLAKYARASRSIPVKDYVNQ